MSKLKYCLFVGLGAVLVMIEEKLSFLSKLGVLGGAWLVSGGFKTVRIVCCTLPRDLTAVWKLIRLVFHTKRAERLNLTVPKVFSKTAQKFPNRVFFYFQDQEWTFQQVENSSNQIARAFLKEGFVKGDTVAVFMENRPEFVCTWLGLAKIGAIPALINYNLRQDPLMHSITVTKCKAVVYGSELSGAVAGTTAQWQQD
jgi:solute carrier family 27 fatty acid transporter 1/4